MNDTDEFAGIPNMPSDAALSASIIKSGHPFEWRPHAKPGAPAPDLESLSDDARKKALAGRMLNGPGVNANAYQAAVFENFTQHRLLEEEQGRIMAELTSDGRGFDPTTGERLPHPQEKARLDRLSEITDMLGRLDGEPGQVTLRRALDKAIHDAKVAHRNSYIMAEAQRRAGASETEAEIERLAAGLRRGKVGR